MERAVIQQYFRTGYDPANGSILTLFIALDKCARIYSLDRLSYLKSLYLNLKKTIISPLRSGLVVNPGFHVFTGSHRMLGAFELKCFFFE